MALSYHRLKEAMKATCSEAAKKVLLREDSMDSGQMPRSAFNPYDGLQSFCPSIPWEIISSLK